MDAFTTATADHFTNAYYGICVTLRVSQVDTSDLNNSAHWTIVSASPQQKSCVGAGTATATQAARVTATGNSSVTANPNAEYVAVGGGLLNVFFQYNQLVSDFSCLTAVGLRSARAGESGYSA